MTLSFYVLWILGVLFFACTMGGVYWQGRADQLRIQILEDLNKIKEKMEEVRTDITEYKEKNK